MIDEPMHQAEIGKVVGRGVLDYEVYLRTAELLSLQHPTNERVHPDELAFQITHQTQELWLRLLAQECVALVGEIDTDALLAANLKIERCLRILASMTLAMEVLSTMTPAAFQVIRRSLGDGSGLQSPGYAAVRRATGVVEEAREAAVLRASTTLQAIYETESPVGLLVLCERLVDFDVAYQKWLVAHFQLVRRTIGVHREVSALDGYPTKALEVRMNRPLFQKLWSARVELTKQWDKSGGVHPGCPRDLT